MDRPSEEQPAAKRQRQEAYGVEIGGAAAGAPLKVLAPEHQDQDDVPAPDEDAKALEAAEREQAGVEEVSSRPLMHPLCKTLSPLRLMPAYRLSHHTPDPVGAAQLLVSNMLRSVPRMA